MIAIFGGAGFLGSYMVRQLQRLEKPYQVFDLNTCQGADYLDVECCSAAEISGVDVIVNLAAEHRDDVSPPSRYMDVNVIGAREVCQLARKSNIKKIVFTSSVAIYGFAPPNTDESGAANYFNEYGRTKLLAEQEYRAWQAEEPDMRTLAIVRPTVIFGPGNRGNVYNLLRQIATKRFVMFGRGQNIKSMAYVENVAHFLVQCTSLSSGIHVYNYVDKPDLSMNQLVQVARKTLFGKSGVGPRMPGFIGVTIGFGFDLLAWMIRRPLPVSKIRVKKFMATTQFSSAAPETGFEAPYTLAQGLEKTLRYEFIEDNRDKPTYETE